MSVAVSVAVSLAGCGADRAVAPRPEPPVDGPSLPSPISLNGSWRALYWTVHTASGDVFDVITEGGSITFQVNSNTVSGSMHVPENVTNGAPLTVSMAGLVRIDGDRVRFEQGQDTFVQRAVWTHHPGDVFDALVLVNTVVQGATYTVVLVRNW